MRAWPILLAAACTPSIVPGAYLCGPNADCPDGLACDGPSFTCVDEPTAQPFVCSSANSTQDLATQLQIDGPQCAATLEGSSCFEPQQTDSWFALAVPACDVTATATVTFPWAFESLGVRLFDGSGAPLGSDTNCTPANASEPQSCIGAAFAAGSAYYFDVVPDGTGNCGGDCDYNAYSLTIQLATN